jgi:hypothetical protein
MNELGETPESRLLGRAFVSSTFTDLREIREEVRVALRRAGYLDIAMEYLTAEDVRPADKCIALVRECDVFIGIIAWRYGSVLPPHRISITELEYETARDAGKPCLIFLLSEQAPWPVSRIDSNRRKIEAFRKRLGEANVVAFFQNRSDIVGKLFEALWKHEKASGVRGLLTEAGDRFRRALGVARDSQLKYYQFFRLFEFQEDIAVETIYVQEILQTKADRSPFDQIQNNAQARPAPIPESEVLKKIEEGDPCTIHVFEGRAGAGKSTMMKMWLLGLLRDKTREARLFPLFVSLRKFREHGGTPGYDALVAAVCDSAPGLDPSSVKVLLDPELPRLGLHELSILLLLDGLDEMPAGARREFLAFLSALPKTIRPVLSTRTGVLTETGYPVRSRCYELCDFEDGQIRAFVHKWFARDPTPGNELLAKIETGPKIKALAAIPLLLTCLAIHVQLYRELRLPDETVESMLLRESVEILVDRWDASREGRAPDLAFIEICFEIFLKMSERPRNVDVSWNDFIQMVESVTHGRVAADEVVRRIVHNGRILAGGVREGVHFSHGIFYDFFFAERVVRALESDRMEG